jgi:hypothetical protein
MHGACEWQALYSLQMFKAAKRAVVEPIPVGGRARHDGGRICLGTMGKSIIVGGSAWPKNIGISKFPACRSNSGSGSTSAQQSPDSEVHVLQQLSVRSSGSSKQTRTGIAATGSNIPRQISKIVAVHLRITLLPLLTLELDVDDLIRQ